MLTAAELASMRATVDGSLPDTVVVKREAATADSEGNPTGTLTTVATTNGWLTHASTRVAGAGEEIAGQDGQRPRRIVILPHDTTVEPGDRLVIDGVTWRAGEVRSDRLHVRCDVTTGEV